MKEVIKHFTYQSINLYLSNKTIFSTVILGGAKKTCQTFACVIQPNGQINTKAFL